MVTGASCGPFDESDEFAERLAGRLVAAHSVPVDAKRECRVGVAELVHDGAWINAERDQEGCERVPQLVRRQPLRQRHMTVLDELLVRFLDCAGKHPPPDVAGALPLACQRREDAVAGRGCVRGARILEPVAQDRQQVDLAPSSVRLRRPDRDPAGGEVDVAPA
jgi:hypothetical protein